MSSGREAESDTRKLTDISVFSRVSPNCKMILADACISQLAAAGWSFNDKFGGHYSSQPSIDG